MKHPKVDRLVDAGILMCGLAAGASAQESARFTSQESIRNDSATADLGRLPLAFVANQGQWETPARFVARRHGQTARFERDAIVLQLTQRDRDDAHVARDAVLRLEFEGANANTTIEGVSPQRGRSNFFIGSDPDKWRTDVPAYSEVLYRGVRPGVDVRVREADGNLEYDLLVAPRADLSRLVIRCRGADGIELGRDGKLSIRTPLGAIEQAPPKTWQETATGERQPVDCHYRRLDDERFGFEVTARDESRPLVIDPGLDWSTFLGGSADDEASMVAVDDAGMVDVVGRTFSTDFPTTGHPFASVLRGTTDVFVARLDPTQGGANQLVWSTYFGGALDEEGYSILAGPAGRIYVSGHTTSTNLPTSAGAFMTARSGPSDGFVAEFDPSLRGKSQLLWSTYFGGSNYEFAVLAGHGVDANGIVTIGGGTTSSDFPVTPGAYDTTHNGGSPIFGSDAYVARLDPSQTGTAQLLYSTFFGGTLDDDITFMPWHQALDVGPDGDITVGGCTTSTDLPTTTGAFDRNYVGGAFWFVSDGYIARFNSKLSRLKYSTFFGGSAWDQVCSLHVADDGSIYFTGSSDSSDVPTSAGCYDATFHGGYDVFVGHLDPAGNGTSDLLYSTYLGDGGDDACCCIALDRSGEVSVYGATSSSAFPTTPGAFQTTYGGGGGDMFVARLRCAGNGASDLTYSTYLGGTALDWGVCFALDANDFPVVVGKTYSVDFPTQNAFQSALAGGSDAFLTRLALASSFNYGAGLAGTNGVPTFTSQSSPVLGNSLTLDLGNSLGATTPGYLLVGLSDANIPAAGGTLLVNAFLILPISVPATGLSMNGSLPNDPTLTGVSVYLQALEADSTAVHGISFTAGLRLILGY